MPVASGGCLFIMIFQYSVIYLCDCRHGLCVGVRGQFSLSLSLSLSVSLSLSLSLSFWFFFSELGTEPKALRFLGKCSTTELNPQPLVPSLQ